MRFVIVSDLQSDGSCRSIFPRGHMFSCRIVHRSVSSTLASGTPDAHAHLNLGISSARKGGSPERPVVCAAVSLTVRRKSPAVRH
jgi:hypothetical protein